MMDIAVWITPEEQEQITAAVVEAQQEFDAWAAQLQTPGAKAEAAVLAQEMAEMWESFEAEVAAGKFGLSNAELEQLRRDAEAFAEEVRAGKYDLTPAELEQLQKDGVLVKKRPPNCHPIKRKVDQDE